MITYYARIAAEIPGVEDGTVMEVVNLPDGQTPETNYAPEVASTFIECPAGVEQFWTYASGQWIPPPWATPTTKPIPGGS